MYICFCHIIIITLFSKLIMFVARCLGWHRIGKSGFDSRQTLTACGPSDDKEVKTSSDVPMPVSR